MARKIVVVDYDPRWPGLFREEAKKIRRVLGKNCVGVHHIGSTAVQGLKAKPVIDIMPVVKDISLVDGLNREFEALGHECKGEFGIPGRRFFTKGGDDRTHHIHIFQADNKEAIERHLAVRDYLRCHPKDAAAYGALKTRLAAEFTYDNDGYCDGKETFVKELEQKALAWRKDQERQGQYMSIGMCFGVAAGSLLGSAMGNLAMGMCMGISVGMCLGLCVGSAKKE